MCTLVTYVYLSNWFTCMLGVDVLSLLNPIYIYHVHSYNIVKPSFKSLTIVHVQLFWTCTTKILIFLQGNMFYWTFFEGETLFLIVALFDKRVKLVMRSTKLFVLPSLLLFFQIFSGPAANITWVRLSCLCHI